MLIWNEGGITGQGSLGGKILGFERKNIQIHLLDCVIIQAHVKQTDRKQRGRLKSQLITLLRRLNCETY